MKIICLNDIKDINLNNILNYKLFQIAIETI